jgi:2-polyprenyl-3-methyl-5-hydroxy-6-metoxy-1,4-benzoquinol methylase
MNESPMLTARRQICQCKKEIPSKIMKAERVVAEHPCDLCGGRDAEVVGERDRDGSALRTVLCVQCGLVRSDPRPGGADLQAYYREDYRLDYKGVRTPKRKHVHRNARLAFLRFGRIRAHLAPGESVLDIGCGGAEFVFALRRLGYQSFGIEPNEGYSRYAREELAVPVTTKFLDGECPAGGPFHLITMFHVLEHVESPKRALATLREWLTPDGRLAVEVPDVESCLSAPGQRFHRAHLYNFNLTTLTALGESVGFHVAETETLPAEASIRVTFQKRAEIPPPPPGGPAFPDNVGRVRTLLARHTNARHYLSATPYARLLKKAGQYAVEYVAVAGSGDNRTLLERLVDEKIRAHEFGVRKEEKS